MISGDFNQLYMKFHTHLSILMAFAQNLYEKMNRNPNFGRQHHFIYEKPNTILTFLTEESRIRQ